MDDAALDALCRLIATRGDRLGVRALPDEVVRAKLLKWSAISEDGLLSHVWCDACENEHLAEVVPAVDGSGYGWLCAEAGFVSADLDELRCYSIARDEIARSLSAGFTRHGTFDPSISPGELWRLGRYRLARWDVELLLAPGVVDEATLSKWSAAAASLPPADLVCVLSAEPKAVQIELGAGLRAVALAEILVVGPEGYPEIDDGQLDARLVRWLPRTQQERGGRPSSIELTREVLDHLRRLSVIDEGNYPRPQMVLDYWEAVHPTRKPLGRSTIKAHLRKLRELGA